MICPTCNCAMSKNYPCRRCAKLEAGGRTIAGSATFGGLHVRQYPGRWTVEVAGYACPSVRVVCSTVSKAHALAYHAKHKHRFGLTAGR